MSVPPQEMSDVQKALADEFRSAITDAHARITSVLEPACPTIEFLTALAAELGQTAQAPDSVPYPELADPDIYWEKSVKPQARALRDSVEAIVIWLEARVVNTMGVAEVELKQVVEVGAANVGANPAAARSDLADALKGRVGILHSQMDELRSVLPSRDSINAARTWYRDTIQQRATSDVEGLKASYLAEAGGDEAHQAYATQQWTDTFENRVAHRAAMLAGEPPWRHQELALSGYERARDEAERVVDAAVERLQAPLAGLTDLLLERYDKATI